MAEKFWAGSSHPERSAGLLAEFRVGDAAGDKTARQVSLSPAMEFLVVRVVHGQMRHAGEPRTEVRLGPAGKNEGSLHLP